MTTELIMRQYQTEDDYWRIRNFLREVFWLNDRREWSWHVARLDYWRWHLVENCQICDPIDQVTFIWETVSGQMAAVLNPESRGEAYLQVHPTFRSPELEQELLAYAEERLATSDKDGQRRLFVIPHEKDALRQDILKQRGYIKRGRPQRQWRRELDAPIPDAPLALGYTVRSMGDVGEFPTRSWASWQAFHPDEPDEQYEGWGWYYNIQAAPLYRRDLDIVAATPTGQIASFCTIWYDDVTRSAYIVLVGTAPAHQQRGLGKAVITEGLRRLGRLGATRAFVTGHEPPANALYASVMDAEHDLFEPWVKE